MLAAGVILSVIGAVALLSLLFQPIYWGGWWTSGDYPERHP